MNDFNREKVRESKEGMHPAHIVRWREKRGDGWGETVYTGILVDVGEHTCIISKLSHGLRVLPKRDDAFYSFVSSPVLIAVSSEFLAEAHAALAADLQFQKRAQEFNEFLGEKNAS